MATIKLCCADLRNRDNVPTEKPGLVISKCRTCGCQHYEWTVDPGILGVRGVPMAKE